MHDANGHSLKVGDKVLIPGEITTLCASEEFCNVAVRTTLGRKPDGEKDTFSALNTAQLVKVSGGGVSLGL